MIEFVSPPSSSRYKKQILVEKLVITLEKLKPDAQLIFLTGYIIAKINLFPESNNVTRLSDIIWKISSNINNGLINFINFVEIIVQTSQTFKIVPNEPSNVTINMFDEMLCGLCGQIACNRKYLKQKWEYKGMEGQYITRGSPKINKKQEQQSLKLIKQLQMQQEKQQLDRQKRADQESQQFVKQLLKQQEERQKKHKQQIQMLQKLQKQSMICQICLEQIAYVDAGALSCGHIFHKACIRSHIQSLINEKKVEISCPAACGVNMPLQDILEFIDGELRQKFEKFCFDLYVEKNDKTISWCPTPGCTSVFTSDDGLDNYRCPICHKHYCLACRCEYHKGMSCAEYRISHSYGEDDKKFEQFVRGSKFKQCPNCKHWVQRTEGCCSMMCRCGKQFCYDCGGSKCPHGSCSNSGGAIGGILPIIPRIFPPRIPILPQIFGRRR